MPAPTPQDEELLVLLADVRLRRPGCVLLQAARGCAEASRFVSETFDSEDWLLAPTPDMRPVGGTREQWKALADDCRRRRNALQSAAPGPDAVVARPARVARPRRDERGDNPSHSRSRV